MIGMGVKRLEAPASTVGKLLPWISLGGLVLTATIPTGTEGSLGYYAGGRRFQSTTSKYTDEFCTGFCSERCRYHDDASFFKCFDDDKHCKCPENKNLAKYEHYYVREPKENFWKKWFHLHLTEILLLVAVFATAGAMLKLLGCYNSEKVGYFCEICRPYRMTEPRRYCRRDNGHLFPSPFWNWSYWEGGSSGNVVTQPSPSAPVLAPTLAPAPARSPLASAIIRPSVFVIPIGEGNGEPASGEELEGDTPPEYLPPPAYHECSDVNRHAIVV